MSQVRVGAVVVAYRSATLLGECLNGILSDPNTVCVVVDNSRDRATAEVVVDAAALWGERVTYVDPGGNLGYSRGCNLGVERMPLDVDFIAVVNPDVRLEVNLTQVVEDPRLPTDWTIVSGCLDTGGDSGVCGNARPELTLVRELAKSIIGGRAYPRYRLLDSGVFQRVGQLDGALMVLRTSDWENLGGFDGQFELYYEDVDLCRRANALLGCWLVGQRWGYHIGGASYSESGGRAYVALRVSRIRYLRKWFGHKGLAAALVFTVVEWGSRTLGGCPESPSDRARALQAAFEEAHHPGAVVVLEGGRL